MSSNTYAGTYAGLYTGKNSQKAQESFRIKVANARHYFVDNSHYLRRTRPFWFYFDGAYCISQARNFRDSTRMRFEMSIVCLERIYKANTNRMIQNPKNKQWIS